MGDAPTETTLLASETSTSSAATSPHTAIHEHGSTGSLGSTILETVSEATGTPSGEINRPLHDVVDLDALERLFSPRFNGMPRTGGRISFSYHDCTVVLESTPDEISVSARPE